MRKAVSDCLHKQATVIWPRRGLPVRYCPECGLVEMLTPDEVERLTNEINQGRPQ